MTNTTTNRAERGNLADALKVHLTGPSPTGYTCKRCEGPSPIGFGYVDNSLTPGVRRSDVTACPCGYSTTSTPA